MKRWPIIMVAVAGVAIEAVAWAQSSDHKSRSRRSSQRSESSQRGESSSSRPPATQPVGASAAPSSQDPKPAASPAAKSPASSSSLAPARGTLDSYDIVVQRNIFLRRPEQAFQPRPIPTPTTRPATPPPSLFDDSPTSASWVLTGTAIVDGERVAFLENARTNETTRVKAGSSIGSLKVIVVDNEGIGFGRDGRTQRAAVGLQLDGSPRGSGGSSNLLSTTPTTAPSGDGAASGGGGSESDMVERMKARRRAEEGK